MRCAALCQPSFTPNPPGSPATFCSSVFIVRIVTPPAARRKSPPSQRRQASPSPPAPLASRGCCSQRRCDPAPGKSSARWGAAGVTPTRHPAPKLYGSARIPLDVPWEIITPVCRSTTTAERRLENTRLGILPYLHLARCITNGIQLNVPALRMGRARKPWSVDRSFFLVITSFSFKSMT